MEVYNLFSQNKSRRDFSFYAALDFKLLFTSLSSDELKMLNAIRPTYIVYVLYLHRPLWNNCSLISFNFLQTYNWLC